MTTNHSAAEQIYLEVYGEVAENADYLQPPSGKDFLLPEAIITALTSTILVTFLQGFFQEAGKDIADLVKERLFNHGKLREVDTDTLIRIVESKVNLLQDHPEKLKDAEQQVEAALLSLGIAPRVAKRLSKRVVEIMMQKKRRSDEVSLPEK